MLPAVALLRALARLDPAALELRNDADDLVVDARGVALAPDLAEPRAAPLRAVLEAALADDAAFVEVTALAPDACTRARWTRDAPAPLVAPASAPAGLTAPTLRVHLRERWSASVAADFFLRRRPELDDLRAAAVAPRCPVTVAGETLGGPPPALASAPLRGLDPGFRGALELIVDGPATVTLCERGWAVASWPMPPLPGRWYAEEPLASDAGLRWLARALRLPEGSGGPWEAPDQPAWSTRRCARWRPMAHEAKGLLAEVTLPCRVWIDLDELPAGLDLTAAPDWFDAFGRRCADGAWRDLLASCATDPSDAARDALRTVLIAGVVREGRLLAPWRRSVDADAGAYRSASIDGPVAPWVPTPESVAHLAELPLLPMREGPPVSLHTLVGAINRPPYPYLTERPLPALSPKSLAAEADHADLIGVDAGLNVAIFRGLRAVDPATRTLSAALPWPSLASVHRAAALRASPPTDDAPTLVLEDADWEAWSGEDVKLQLRGHRVDEGVHHTRVLWVIDGLAAVGPDAGRLLGCTRAWRWEVCVKAPGLRSFEERNSPFYGAWRVEVPDGLLERVGRALLRFVTAMSVERSGRLRVAHAAPDIRPDEVLAAQGPELFSVALSLAPSTVVEPLDALRVTLGGHEAALRALYDPEGGVGLDPRAKRLWINLAGDEALGAWRPELRSDPWRRAALRLVDQAMHRWRWQSRNWGRLAHEAPRQGALLVLHHGRVVRVVPLRATSPLAIGVLDDPAVGEALSAPSRAVKGQPARVQLAAIASEHELSWHFPVENEPVAHALVAAVERAARSLADPAAAAVLTPRLRALRARFRPAGAEQERVAAALAALPVDDGAPPAEPLDASRADVLLATSADPSPLALAPEARDALRAWVVNAWASGDRFDGERRERLRRAAIWPTLSGRYVALAGVATPCFILDAVTDELRRRVDGWASQTRRLSPERFGADWIVLPTTYLDQNTDPESEGPVWQSWHLPASLESLLDALAPGSSHRVESGHARGP